MWIEFQIINCLQTQTFKSDINYNNIYYYMYKIIINECFVELLQIILIQ